MNSSITMEEAELTMINFIEEYIPNTKRSVLIGYTIHISYEFLLLDMPELACKLTDKMLDLTSLNELVKSWYPNVEVSCPNQVVRALIDIENSINDFKRYRDVLFNGNGSPLPIL